MKEMTITSKAYRHGEGVVDLKLGRRIVFVGHAGVQQVQK
jgi:hypothetical protein